MLRESDALSSRRLSGFHQNHQQRRGKGARGPARKELHRQAKLWATKDCRLAMRAFQVPKPAACLEEVFSFFLSGGYMRLDASSFST